MIRAAFLCAGVVLAIESLPAAAQTGTSRPAERECSVVVDLSAPRQVMDHFGASDCWSIQAVGKWSEPNRERVAELLFSKTKGIGLSMWRVNIAGGVNEKITEPWRTSEGFEVGPGKYDWNHEPGQRWFISAAKRFGVEKYLAFANSPPGRLTRNALTNVAGEKGTTNLKEGMEGEFARYLADVVEHFAHDASEPERVKFDWVSPVNEPQWNWEGNGQEGCRYSNADILRVGIAVGAELERRRLETKLHLVEAGTITSMYGPSQQATRDYAAPYGNYVDVLLADKALAKYMAGVIGYHSYWSDSARDLLPTRTILATKMLAHPGWNLWQTEYCVMEHKRDLGMDTALRMAEVIHADLTVAGVSGWSWWLAVSNSDYKDGLIFTDYHKPGDAENVLPGKLLWTLGQWSRFVRPGMRRLETKATGGVLASAFVEPASGRVVVVIVNKETQGAQIKLDVGGGPRHWEAYLTSEAPGDDLRPLGVVPPDRVNIPRRATMTLVEVAK